MRKANDPLNPMNRVGSNCGGGAYETFARGSHTQHQSQAQSCSVTHSRIAATISGALCRGDSVCSSRSSTAIASISCHVRVASRQRRRARFISSKTISAPTIMPNTKLPKDAYTVIGSTGACCTSPSLCFATSPFVSGGRASRFATTKAAEVKN